MHRFTVQSSGRLCPDIPSKRKRISLFFCMLLHPSLPIYLAAVSSYPNTFIGYMWLHLGGESDRF